MFDLPTKKEDLVQQAVKAFENYAYNRYDESAVQARKSGESIAKILLAKNSRAKLPLTERSGYKELIAAVKEHTPATKKTVNLLETLQLIGNKASHDSITASDAEYAINALRLLCQHVFTEALNEPVPPRLVRYLEQDDAKQRLLEEIETLKKQFREKQNDPQEEKNILPVASDQELLDRIKELENKIGEVEARSKEQTVRTPEPVIEKEPVVTELPKTERKKWIVPVLVLGLVAVIFFMVWLSSGKKRNQKRTVVNAVEQPAFTIGIFDFDVVDDNKLVKLDIEKEILEYIKEVAADNKWNIAFRRMNQKLSKDPEEAKDQCINENVQLAIRGFVKENRKGDSSLVHLDYIYTFQQQTRIFYGSFNELKLDMNNMNGLQQLKKETAVLMNFGLGISNYYSGQVKEAFSLTENLYSSSAYLMINIHQLNYNCLSALGNFEGARHEAYHYLKAFPDSAGAYEMYAQSLEHFLPESSSKIDSALGVLEKKRPQSAVLWYLKAKYLTTMNRSKNLALQYAAKSVQLDDQYYEGMVFYASLLMENNQVGEGFEKAKQAVSIDPARYESYWVMGEKYFGLRQFPQALTMYRQVLEKNGVPQEFRADTYEKMGTAYYYLYATNPAYADSVVYFLDKAVETGSKRPDLVYASKAGFYFQTGDTMAAIATMRKAVEKNPDFLYGYESLTRYYFLQKRYGNMKAQAEKAIALDPVNLSANAALANYYVRFFPSASTHVKASGYINRLLKLEKNNPDHFLLKGHHLLYNLEQLDSAAYYFEKAAVLNKTPVGTWYALGEIYYRKKNFAKAIEAFKKCIALKPSHTMGLIGLSQSYLGLKYSRTNILKALEYAGKAIETDARSGLAHFTMAQIYLVDNKPSEAKIWYDKAVALDLKMKNPEFERSMDEMYRQMSKGK